LQLIIAIMPHLAFALISVLAHVAASAEKTQLYELMKAEYTDERCDTSCRNGFAAGFP